MKSRITCVLFCVFYICTGAGVLLSRPERFEPLLQYKRKTVSRKGPIREKVISKTPNNPGEEIASAIYSYNDKNQLIQGKYFLNGKKNGKTIYKYNPSGLSGETSYDEENREVEEIQYTANQFGDIIKYKVNRQNIVWSFLYRNRHLKSGKKFINKKVTESFTFRTRTPVYALQELFTGKNKKIGSVKYFYENQILIRRVREDNLGMRKAEYKYLDDGRLKEMLLFETSEAGSLSLVKKHIFIYSN